MCWGRAPRGRARCAFSASCMRRKAASAWARKPARPSSPRDALDRSAYAAAPSSRVRQRRSTSHGSRTGWPVPEAATLLRHRESPRHAALSGSQSPPAAAGCALTRRSSMCRSRWSADAPFFAHLESLQVAAPDPVPDRSFPDLQAGGNVLDPRGTGRAGSELGVIGVRYVTTSGSAGNGVPLTAFVTGYSREGAGWGARSGDLQCETAGRGGRTMGEWRFPSGDVKAAPPAPRTTPGVLSVGPSPRGRARCARTNSHRPTPAFGIARRRPRRPTRRARRRPAGARGRTGLVAGRGVRARAAAVPARPGTGRRGPEELWARFDDAVERLNQAGAGDSLAELVAAYAAVANAAGALAHALRPAATDRTGQCSTAKRTGATTSIQPDAALAPSRAKAEAIAIKLNRR